MRALLLVCVGLVRVGAFASLPDSEQIESRNAGSTHVKVRSNAYCGNRVCAGESCAQSRTTVNAAACAAAVMKDPKCGNSFSFSMNLNDVKLRYCDCAPVGAPCVATPFAFYDVYELVFDKAAVYTQQQLESAEAQARADAKKGMVTQEKYDSKAAECDNAAAPPPQVVESEVAERSLRRSPLNLAKACTGDAARNAGSAPYVKMKTNWYDPHVYCSNRVCANGECAQSRVTVDAAACAAAVLKDPKCGNSFSFGENSDPNLQYCDCPPPGQPCEPNGYLAEGYSTYELIFDVSCGAGTSLMPLTLTCVPDASACGAGTLLDPVTMTCTPLGWDDDVQATKLELMAALYKNPNDPYGKELKGDLSGIEDWDVSRIDDFSDVFRDAYSFNADLSKWDVAQGTDFSYMFGGADFNADLSNWDVAQGTNFASMFAGASSFNADLSKWNVAKGSIVAAMFVVAGCKTTNCGCTSCA